MMDLTEKSELHRIKVKRIDREVPELRILEPGEWRFLQLKVILIKSHPEFFEHKLNNFRIVKDNRFIHDEEKIAQHIDMKNTDTRSILSEESLQIYNEYALSQLLKNHNKIITPFLIDKIFYNYPTLPILHPSLTKILRSDPQSTLGKRSNVEPHVIPLQKQSDIQLDNMIIRLFIQLFIAFFIILQLFKGKNACLLLIILTIYHLIKYQEYAHKHQKNSESHAQNIHNNTSTLNHIEGIYKGKENNNASEAFQLIKRGSYHNSLAYVIGKAVTYQKKLIKNSLYILLRIKELFICFSLSLFPTWNITMYTYNPTCQLDRIDNYNQTQIQHSQSKNQQKLDFIDSFPSDTQEQTNNINISHNKSLSGELSSQQDDI